MANVKYWMNLNNYIEENSTGDYTGIPKYIMEHYKSPYSTYKASELFKSETIKILVLMNNDFIAILQMNNNGHSEIKTLRTVMPYAKIVELNTSLKDLHFTATIYTDDDIERLYELLRG